MLQVLEKERLLQFADALRSKLQYFDELERVSAEFHSASLAVDSDSFLPLLERLDECISCVAFAACGLHIACTALVYMGPVSMHSLFCCEVHRTAVSPYL